jgi:CPA2 family monovalent cation:H+ antiporter-2
VGIDRAKAIVLTHGEDPAGTLRLVKHLRIHLPELSILARARDNDHAEALRNAGANDAVPDALASSLHLAQSVMTAFELPPTDIDKLMSEFGGRR